MPIKQKWWSTHVDRRYEVKFTIYPQSCRIAANIWRLLLLLFQAWLFNLFSDSSLPLSLSLSHFPPVSVLCWLGTLLCFTGNASRATLITGTDYGGCQRESHCSIAPNPQQQEEKDSQTGGKPAKFQWLLVTSQAWGNTLMPKNVTVLKLDYFSC